MLALTACGDDDDPTTDGADAVDVDPGTATDDSGSDGDDGDGDEPDDAPDDAAPGGGADDDAFVEGAVDDLVGGTEVEPELARCIASAVVDAAGGAQTMREVGLDADTWFPTPESFEELGLPADDEAIDGLADGLGECGDGYQLLFTAGGPEVSDAVKQCVTDAVDEAQVRRALASSIIRSQVSADDSEDVFRVVRRCEDDAQPG